MLSTTSQYAIRALSHLARMQHGEAVLGRDLAERASVPVNYLSKIMLVMRNAGLVQATRGAGGGYRLARPAATVAPPHAATAAPKWAARPPRVPWRSCAPASSRRAKAAACPCRRSSTTTEPGGSVPSWPVRRP